MHRGGVFETVSIHFIDLFLQLYGYPNTLSCQNRIVSPFGDAIDNSNFTCVFEDGPTVNIFSSYTSPFLSELLIIYENGYVKFDEVKKFFYPRDVFDDKGLFKTPDIIHSESISRKQIAHEATEKSMEHFLNHALHGKPFNDEHFDCSMKSSEIIIEMSSEHQNPQDA